MTTVFLGEKTVLIISLLEREKTVNFNTYYDFEETNMSFKIAFAVAVHRDCAFAG